MEKSIVSLRLMSDTLDPDALAAGLTGTVEERWRKGERRGSTRLTHAENGVELRGPVGFPEDLEEQLSLLMERVRPNVEYICSLKCDCVQLSLVVYDTTAVGYHFAPDVIELLSSIGASIDVDQYLVAGLS